MIKSMTGYGRGKFESNGREYTVEIKSVNNRFCDVSVKLPRSISYLEEKIKLEYQINLLHQLILVLLAEL